MVVFAPKGTDPVVVFAPTGSVPLVDFAPTGSVPVVVPVVGPDLTWFFSERSLQYLQFRA